MKRTTDPSIDPHQAVVLLRTLPLLHKLPEESLPKIAAVLKTLRFGPGEHIVRVNQEGDGLYIIWKGEAKVVSPPREGDSGHTVSTLKFGDYFGLATPGPARELYRADVVANTEVTCLLLTHEYADLIASASNWDWSDQPAEGEPALMERILTLEKLEADVFSTCIPQPYRNLRRNPNIFGGQSIGQALLAATRTVDPGYIVHSLHSYFIRAGKEDVCTLYKVQRTRDGMSFATRFVEATQLGKVTFVMFASFKRPDTQAYEHSDRPMPSAPSPEEVTGEEVSYDSFLTDPRLALAVKTKYAGMKLPLAPIELRLCDPSDRFQKIKMEARQRIWWKARHKLSDDPVLHRCAAAYASDLHLLETCLRSHPQYHRSRMQILSLDHTIWFHRPFKADKWVLYEMEGPWAGDARGLTFGRMYQDGELVMTVAQEGMIRRIEEKKEKTAKL